MVGPDINGFKRYSRKVTALSCNKDLAFTIKGATFNNREQFYKRRKLYDLCLRGLKVRNYTIRLTFQLQRALWIDKKRWLFS